jgi:hypothetical protein
MKTQFETEVSGVLAAQAASLPEGATLRLRSIDYHPRERRLRVPVISVGAVAGAATVGTALAVVLGGGSPAYAGWSATPTSGIVPASADASCQAELASMQSRSIPQGASEGSGSWVNVLTDIRGPFTVSLFRDDGAAAACFMGPSFSELNMIAGQSGSTAMSGISVSQQSRGGSSGVPAGRSSSSSATITGSSSLPQVIQSHLTTPSNGPYTLIDGPTQAGLTGVTLVLNDGQDVVASVADGWFVAWWPGNSDATAARVTTASGTTTQPLLRATQPNPPSLPPKLSNPSPSKGRGPALSRSTSSGNAGVGPSTFSNP